jgi:two-component system LytT family response regulator
MIRTMIADDEPLARERLRSLLRDESDFDVVAECSAGDEAVAAIASHQPDVVFLDVRMPELDAFEVMERAATPKPPSFVLVTAFDEYARQAFDVQAVDYLLKPVTRERFQDAAARARRRVADARARASTVIAAPEPAPAHYAERFLVRSSGRIVVVKVQDIDWIDGAGNYVKLHTGKSSHLLRHTLSALVPRLDPRRFLRIHRSTIIQVDRLAELQTTFSGDYVVILKDGTRLALSRTYRHALRQLAGEGA